ncbi:MAG: nickel-dependent hydrogenase large subunit [Candidatus Altiarchaeota archaeon]
MKIDVPVGVVHPALLEPFRIRFLVEDEVIEDCEITFNAAHKGVERILEGLPIKNANIVTERVCGICSHIHLWSSCRVTEKTCQINVPERANYVRVMAAELERLHSHLLFFGHAFEVLGQETFSYRSFALRESVMGIMHEFSGNRVHYAVPVIGGIRPRCDLDDQLVKRIGVMVDGLESGLKSFVERVLDDPLVMSRVSGTGVLSGKIADETHAVGPVARSSGLKDDWRKEIPEYEDFDFNVVVLKEGDNKARIVSRGLEMMESMKVIRQVLEGVPSGPIVSYDKPELDTEFASSYMEAPRGELYHSLKVDAGGKVRNYRIRTPTTTNLGAVEKACVGDHLTDGMLTVVSCDPCLCCANRAIVVDAKTGGERIVDFNGGALG